MSGFDWRKYLRVHPAADKLPMMEKAELEELAEDIKANGLRTGVVIWNDPLPPDGALPQLLDGRNQLDAMAKAGLLAVNNEGPLCIRVADDDEQGLRLIKYNHRGGDPDKLIFSLNVYRRHLTPERRRALIAALLTTDPTQSDRQIGKQIHADHKTVGRDRAALETRGTIPHVEVRTDTKGRKQPARKQPKPIGKRPEESGHEAVYATQLRLLENEWANAGVVTKQRFVSAHAGEIAALLKPATGGASS